MLTALLPGIFEIGSKVIDRVFPDKEKQAEAKLKLLEMQQAGEFKQLEADLQLALGQLEVNKAEAESTDFFRAGWRPFVGWVCGFGLAYQFVLRPLLPWAVGLFDIAAAPMPPLELDTLLTLLLGMLGLGGLRTSEKLKGLK